MKTGNSILRLVLRSEGNTLLVTMGMGRGHEAFLCHDGARSRRRSVASTLPSRHKSATEPQ